MGSAALCTRVKLYMSGRTTKSKNPTWLLVTPCLARSNSGEIGMLAAFSRSPCRKNSSSRQPTQRMWTCRGELMWPMSAHLSAIWSVRIRSFSSSGTRMTDAAEAVTMDGSAASSGTALPTEPPPPVVAPDSRSPLVVPPDSFLAPLPPDAPPGTAAVWLPTRGGAFWLPPPVGLPQPPGTGMGAPRALLLRDSSVVAKLSAFVSARRWMVENWPTIAKCCFMSVASTSSIMSLRSFWYSDLFICSNTLLPGLRSSANVAATWWFSWGDLSLYRSASSRPALMMKSFVTPMWP
mmetsp:Transcript_40399/g.89718  ORF Transcript_40399/g.89718 Transcript_40399/m.89718 type:complete len:293 (+) Transcript_40399:2135-3013(+)